MLPCVKMLPQIVETFLAWLLDDIEIHQHSSDERLFVEPTLPNHFEMLPYQIEVVGLRTGSHHRSAGGFQCRQATKLEMCRQFEEAS